MSSTMQTVPPEVAAMLDVSTDPAVVLSPDYRILAANEAYRHVYGADDLIGQHCYEVSHHYTVPCDQAGETCPLEACRQSGHPRRNLHLHHTPRGEEHVDVEILPVRDSSGALSFFVEVMRHATVASATPESPGLVGRSPTFNKMLELVQRSAPSDVAVLLLGETGTGKEMVAQAVHDASNRATGAFVPVECSGLTETLFESELFGHEKGAFTGALSRKPGLVEAARGGTLFLDEVGDIPLPMQVKLLRLLETGTYRRVGSVEQQKADFRLICATHRGLPDMVRKGAFREDLYYRISAFPIPLPALRDRPEDLPLLVETILARIAPDRRLTVAPDALAILARHGFPGNVRELRNILERAAIMTDGSVIHAGALPDDLGGATENEMGAQAFDLLPLEQVERQYIARALARFPGDRKALAEKLGVSERTLYRKIRELETS